jgi:hypothetical protein
MGPIGFGDAGLPHPGVADGKRFPRRAPGCGPAFEARHLIDPHLYQKLRRPEGADAALAQGHHGAITRDLVQP